MNERKEFTDEKEFQEEVNKIGKEAKKSKEIGNEFFQKGDYATAIEYYSKAIEVLSISNQPKLLNIPIQEELPQKEEQQKEEFHKEEVHEEHQTEKKKKSLHRLTWNRKKKMKR